MHNSFEEELTVKHHLLTTRAQEHLTVMKHKTDMAVDSKLQAYKHAAKIRAQEECDKLDECTLSSVSHTAKSHDKARSPITT